LKTKGDFTAYGKQRFKLLSFFISHYFAAYCKTAEALSGIRCLLNVESQPALKKNSACKIL
jgi:hypothetical protein